MTSLSIEAGFTWAQRFAAREWRLLLPVALAFLVLPPLAFDLLLPPGMAKVFTAPPIQDLGAVRAALTWLLPAMLAMLALAMLGALAITALAVLPGISVGEAITVAARRLPAFLGALAIAGAGFFAATVLLMVLAQLARIGPGAVRGLLVVGIVVAILAGIRLVLVAPVMIEGRLGPIAGITAAWRMAGGSFWRIVGGLLIYLFGGLIILMALTTALNAVILLIARLAGQPEVARPLIALLSRSMAGLVSTGSYLLVVGFYRQLAGSSKAV